MPSNNPNVFLWTLNVLHYWQTYFYTNMKHNLFRNCYGIEKKIAVSFNHTYRYIDDVLSINNHNFHNYVYLIYPEELEIKDTTESDICFLSRYDFTQYWLKWQTDFAIVNFLFFFYSNIPLSPAYGVYRFDTKDHVLRIRPLQCEVNYWQKLSNWRCKVSMVSIMTLFAITNYHWPICWIICFVPFVQLSFPYWLWRRVITYT
jgi:hypothetical protein